MNNLRNTANRLAEKRGKDEGFTLIELLVVIVILGILAAVVVFAVGGITDKGDVAACAADRKTVEVAQEAYFAKGTVVGGDYADSIAELVTAGLLRAPGSTKHTTSDSGVVVGIAPCT